MDNLPFEKATRISGGQALSNGVNIPHSKCRPVLVYLHNILSLLKNSYMNAIHGNIANIIQLH